MEDGIPKGEIFSRHYIPRGAPVYESLRARKRLSAAVQEIVADRPAIRGDLASSIKLSLGVDVPFHAGGFYLGGFFETTSEFLDVIGAITVVARILRAHQLMSRADGWVSFARDVLEQENLAYYVDSLGGVHPKIDEEFQRSRVASVAALSAPKHAAALHEFEKAFARFDTIDPDTAAAVREIHVAAESLAKTLTGETSDLDARFVAKFVVPQMKRKYAGQDSRVVGAAEQMCSALGKWVDAGHNYRHGHGAEAPVKPPLDFAVLYLSQGAAYVRWLVDVFNGQ